MDRFLVFPDNDDNGDHADVPTKVNTSAKRARPSGKVEGKTVEQHRRAFGDAVKQHISFEKWAIAADTHCVYDMSAEVFRTLVVPHSHVVTPVDWTVDTPVVLAQVEGAQVAELCGATKIRAGSRVQTWSAHKMDIVFLPKDGKIRVWWVMA